MSNIRIYVQQYIVSTILGILSFMKDTRSKFITDYY